MWTNKETVQSKSNNANNSGLFFKGQAVQAKLQVNEPGDSFEKQADSVADRIMRMPGPSVNDTAFFKPAIDTIQRKTHEYEEDDLHRKESSDAPANGSHQLDSYVGSLSSSGKPLPTGSRQFFESRFGYDFSNVRIHTDSGAAQSTQSINALAYTTGNNIVFNSGQYAPESETGKKLMAHELTHVVQQSDNIQPSYIKPASNIVQRSPNPPGWDELHNYKHPGSVALRFTHFTTKNLTNDPFNDYAAKAKTLLGQHNLGLNVVEGGEIDFQTPLQMVDDVAQLRAAVDKKGLDTTTRLPVVSAVWSTEKGFDASDLNGETFKGMGSWLPFVVLNTANTSADKVTALHEAGHAASVPGRVDTPVGKDDAVQNFMLYGDNRTDMIKPQILAIVKAYFAV
jgi:hypothetical protein